MVVRTYGTLEYDKNKDSFCISKAEPHICIKLKHIFQVLRKSDTVPFYFSNTPEHSHDLLWFMERYPLAVTPEAGKLLNKGRKNYINDINERERILLPDYQPSGASFKDGLMARHYQLQARDMEMQVKRLLLTDEMGLGKTVSAILCMLAAECRPAAVVCQTHLPIQWKREIERFTGLTVHIVKTRKAYNLPPADVYIYKYSSLSGWTDLFGTSFFKMAVFDECQELRCIGSDKYNSALALSKNVNYCLGMSGTPVYNYGIEIYNILNLIKPGCLGESHDFVWEWCKADLKKVSDPKALGSYLRENMLMLRRTRAEVGRELPVVNKLVYEVEYDHHEANKVEKLARQLALAATTGSFMARGEAARELDVRVRHATGVAKALSVAAWVRMFMETGEPIVLAGWHREVYDIWLRELADFNPVMYTGSESPKQKDEAVAKFIAGETNLFIISSRSGVGLDGLQKRCKTVIVGELDWSPKVHDQLICRLDRDGQQEQVTAIFLTTNWGSDPDIIDMLGIKSSQAHGIVDPTLAAAEQYSDESRIKKLAQRFLKNREERIPVTDAEIVE